MSIYRLVDKNNAQRSILMTTNMHTKVMICTPLRQPTSRQRSALTSVVFALVGSTNPEAEVNASNVNTPKGGASLVLFLAEEGKVMTIIMA